MSTATVQRPLARLLTDDLVFVEPAEVAAHGLPDAHNGVTYVSDVVVCWLASLVGRSDFFGTDELRYSAMDLQCPVPRSA